MKRSIRQTAKPRVRKTRAVPQAVTSYAVPALEKGLDVLELFSQTRQALGLNGIAARLNRSRQELFRVVTCLQARGYLQRDVAGNYRLTSKMLEVGSRQIADQVLVSQAMPAMEALADSTGESCQLSLVGRERLLIVAGAVGSAHLQLEVKVGSSIPLFHSVVGLVALAFLSDDDEQQSHWQRRREIQRRGGDVIEPALVSFRAWQGRLEKIRRAGFAARQSPAHLGSRVHAGPLLDAAGKLRGVLSLTRLVAVRERSARDAEISHALLDCCRKISAALGAGETPQFRE